MPTQSTQHNHDLSIQLSKDSDSQLYYENSQMQGNPQTTNTSVFHNVSRMGALGEPSYYQDLQRPQCVSVGSQADYTRMQNNAAQQHNLHKALMMKTFQFKGSTDANNQLQLMHEQYERARQKCQTEAPRLDSINTPESRIGAVRFDRGLGHSPKEFLN